MDQVETQEVEGVGDIDGISRHFRGRIYRKFSRSERKGCQRREQTRGEERVCLIMFVKERGQNEHEEGGRRDSIFLLFVSLDLDLYRDRSRCKF